MSAVLLSALAPYAGSILTAVAGYFLAYRIHGQPGAPAVPSPASPVPVVVPALPGVPANVGGLLAAIGPQLLAGFEQVALAALQQAAQSWMKQAAANHLLPALAGGAPVGGAAAPAPLSPSRP